MERRTRVPQVEKKSSIRLSPSLGGILATAVLGLSLCGPQVHAQTPSQAELPDACHTVMFHYPHNSSLPDQGYITDEQIDREELSIAQSAAVFSEGLDPDLRFSSLSTSPIGFAEVCNDDDETELIMQGAFDIEEEKIYEVGGVAEVLDDAEYPDKSVLQIMKPEETRSRGATGAKAGLDVVLIDMGVDTNHSATKDQVSKTQKCFSEAREGFKSSCPNGKNEDNSAHISDAMAAHGTMMLGLITTVSEGNVIPIQTSSIELDQNGNPERYVLFGSNIAKAYDWVIGSSDRIAAVNASYGAGTYTSTSACVEDNTFDAELVGRITRKGISFVTASGNTPGLNFTSSPACLPEAIAVGSTTSSDTMAFHTSMAEWVDLLAPGEMVMTTFPGEAYVWGTGTSGSTALVSGAIQVQKDIYEGGSPAFMKQNLIDTGVKVEDHRTTPEGKSNGLHAMRVDFRGMAYKWIGDYVRQHPADKVYLPNTLQK